MSRLWTDSEIETLKECFIKGIPDDVIGLRLGRSKDSVKIKRKKLRIVGNPHNRRISDESRLRMSEARKRIPPHRHPSWKGGRRVNSNGYVEVRMPEHHRSRGNNYVFEHILVAEKKLGRKLVPGEDVHHIDGIKTNNHPDNLQVLSHAEHARMHPKKRTGQTMSCVVCGTAFYRKPSHVNRAKCCSGQCVGKYTHMKKGEKKNA